MVTTGGLTIAVKFSHFFTEKLHISNVNQTTVLVLKVGDVILPLSFFTPLCNSTYISATTTTVEVKYIIVVFPIVFFFFRSISKYRLFSGLWFGNEKPFFSTFLKPFVDMICAAQVQGKKHKVQVIICGISFTGKGNGWVSRLLM